MSLLNLDSHLSQEIIFLILAICNSFSKCLLKLKLRQSVINNCVNLNQMFQIRHLYQNVKVQQFPLLVKEIRKQSLRDEYFQCIKRV